MTLLGQVLFPPANYRRTTLSTVIWWETKRVKFNLIVGSTGLVTLAAIHLIAWLPPALPMPGPPIGFVAAYALAANVCYSLGWGIELVLQRIMGRRAPALGPALFRQGVAFSVGLTLLPIGITAFAWTAHAATVILHWRS